MNRMDHWIDNLFKKQRWIIHIFFWFMVLAIYVIFFGHKNSDYLQTLFLVGLLMPITIGTAYFLNYKLVPKYLMKERYGKFILYFIYTLIASLYMQMLTVILIFIVLADSKIRNMSPASVNIFFCTYCFTHGCVFNNGDQNAFTLAIITGRISKAND